MSFKSLLVILPEELEIIVHYYTHQLKFKEVMDELKSKVEYCSTCDEEKVNHQNDTCNQCCEFICSECYIDERDFCSYEEEPECFHCRTIEEYFNEEEETTESEIAYAEEELWRDVYGVQSMSQIY